MKPILEVRNLWKQYKIGGQQATYLSLREKLLQPFQRQKVDTFWALEDINFDVYEGECIGIIGRNGAGKSTLLKILSQITPPTKGYIKARGRIASLLEVGTGFHPELTGRENVYLNGSILGLKRSEINNKFDEIVDFSGIEKFLDTPLKHYSSGMKLRLAFSVAAYLEPEILLIDEVLAVGDAEFQKKCLGKMDEVSKSGRTVLFVSHNLGAVRQLCEKSILLLNGKIDCINDTDAIINIYQSKLPNISEQLSNLRTRFGNGAVQFHSIKILNKSTGLPINHSIISGSEIQFEIQLKNNTALEIIQDLHIGLVVKNANNEFITVLNNKMANFHFNNVSPSVKILCDVGKLPLMYGTYTLSAFLEIDFKTADFIEETLVIKVLEGDFYNSGKPNAHKRQGVYIPQKWSINE